MTGLVILAAILFFGILTMWVPARWTLSEFEIALCALAAFSIVKRFLAKRPLSIHPVAIALALAAAWGILQIASHHTVYEVKTRDAVLGWIVNLTAFSLALEYAGNIVRRERFLRVILIFAFLIAIFAIFTGLTSPPGFVFWKFDIGTGVPVLGPFPYRNQYAA